MVAMNPLKYHVHRFSGFTIVELLIVIVIISILASVTVVAYNGVTNKAYDSAVQGDLEQMGKTVLNSEVINGTYPIDQPSLLATGVKVDKNAYGHGIIYNGGEYNVLYCSTTTTSPTAADRYGFIAASKSGNVYAWSNLNGNVSSYSQANWTASGAGWGTLCPDLLQTTTGNINAGIYLYSNGVWQL